MSSMTIDQLKKSLTEQGVTLPPRRSKKADYIKLYNQYSTINDSLGDVYSSDDENPPRTGSQNVTSSSSPTKIDSIAREVEQLTDDELYLRLKEFDDKIGPVLKNTRRVYEKKLIKILTSGKQTNGYESTKQNEKITPTFDEFSDSDIEIISKSSKKAETKGRKSSVLRDSPKPSVPETSSRDFERSFPSNYEHKSHSASPDYSSEVKSSRFSYIETIPKGSSYSYIEPDTEVDYGSGDLRQRFTDRFDINKFSSDKYSTNRSSTDDVYKPTTSIGDSFKSGLSNSYKYGLGGSDYKSGLGGDDYKSGLGGGDYRSDLRGGDYKSDLRGGDYKSDLRGGDFKSGLGGGDYKSGFASSSQYKPGLGMSSQYKSGGGFGGAYSGTWEPNINRYLNIGAQQKKLMTNSKGFNFGNWFRTFIAALLILAMLMLIYYIYQQWTSIDPYKMIEDDAERKIQELSEGSGNF